MNIGVIGMHEMPETLSNNLKKIGYNAMYFEGGFREVLKQRSLVDVLIVIFPFGRLKSIVLAKLLGMKVVVLWIGTDCLLAQNNPYRAKVKLISPLIDLNVADAPHLIDELSETGIEAEFIPIIPGLMKSDPLPMPEDFRVLSYIMPDRPEFYGATMIKEIANKMPEVEFFITEEGRVPDPTPNIKHLGFLSQSDMEKIYRDVSVLLRLTKHDGISKMVLEALGYGRYVIRTIDFPACFKATTVDGVVNILRELKEERRPNMVGVEFIRKELNWNNIKEKWQRVFDRL